MKSSQAKVDVVIARMKPSNAKKVATLVQDVVTPLEYYSKAARSNEIAKYTPANLKKMCKEDPDSVLIALKEAEVVGFCLSRYDDGLIWLAWFGVHPACRGQGVGGKMLDTLERTVKKRGAHKLWCDCRINNTQSKGVLIGSGFVPMGLVRNHWYGHDFILWEKDV